MNEVFGSVFELRVCEALRRSGLGVDAQVPAGRYRVDLAIRDPRDPGRYLLGLECDGARYHSGTRRRLRDLDRQEELERLGWRIHRVWSRDWQARPYRELRRILDLVGPPGSGGPDSAPRVPADPGR